MKSAFGQIGSAVEAWTLANAPRDGWGNPETPAGWRWLGEGVSRTAFLSPTGVVYKFEYDGSGCNMDEYEAAMTIQSKLRASSARTVKALKTLYFPKVRYFENMDILAMEYIEELGDEYGDGPSFCDAEQAACDLGIGEDFHRGNVVNMADGRWAIIDFGYEYCNPNKL